MGIITLIVVKDTMRAMCDYSRDVGFVLPWRQGLRERGFSEAAGPSAACCTGLFWLSLCLVVPTKGSGRRAGAASGTIT